MCIKCLSFYFYFYSAIQWEFYIPRKVAMTTNEGTAFSSPLASPYIYYSSAPIKIIPYYWVIVSENITLPFSPHPKWTSLSLSLSLSLFLPMTCRLWLLIVIVMARSSNLPVISKREILMPHSKPQLYPQFPHMVCVVVGREMLSHWEVVILHLTT